MTDDEARALFSDYVENMLDPSEKDKLQAYLAASPEIAAELIQFQRMLTVVHRLPPEEPRLDMWSEFAPRMAEYKAHRKMVPAERFKLRWSELISSVSAGLILYTHALAHRTHRRFARYLLADTTSSYENNTSDA